MNQSKNQSTQSDGAYSRIGLQSITDLFAKSNTVVPRFSARRLGATIGCMLCAACLAACTTPGRRIDALASDLHFQRVVEPGKGFRHVVYRNHAPMRNGVLHVYLEGDGTPYWQGNLTAPDPTPRNPLMLRLMALDPDQSIYVGRACYLGLYRDAACHPIFWTLRRYGPEVLVSLGAVLRSEAARSGAARLELFGHSGGGTLAVLLAQRLEPVTRVVTVAANLDLAAWCQLHDFSPLAGSISPVDEPPMRNGVTMLHLVGGRDTNTPPWMVLDAARARGGEPVRVIEGFDHACCWESLWKDILEQSR